MNTSSTLGSRTTQRRSSNGWFFRDLNNRSPAHGGLNKSRWGEFARDEVKTCSGDQSRGIALHQSEHTVGHVALASMGLTADMKSLRTLEDVIRAEYQPTYHDLRVLLPVICAMRTENERGQSTEEHKQEPRAEARCVQSTQPILITRAGGSPPHEDHKDTPPPIPYGYALAACDAPSEGRECWQAQDKAAGGSQDTDEWSKA